MLKNFVIRFTELNQHILYKFDDCKPEMQIKF
jgi:hypothetical protein